MSPARMAKLALGVSILCSLITTIIEALRLASLDVPSSVSLGAAIWLNCTLDKEKDDLYSVKWYKNDDEFYRYLPRDKPALQKYDLPGIYLDVAISIEGHVFLTSTDQHTEGTFRCEASAEAPSFQTVNGEKDLTVYAIPTDGPVIEGDLGTYDAGEIINVTCRSGKSRPPATLMWQINKQDVIRRDYLINYPTVNDSNGLGASALGLILNADAAYFVDGALTLKCVSTLSQIHVTTSEKLIAGGKIQQQHESMPSSNYIQEDDSPIITGNSSNHTIGQQVNMNCSLTIANTTPELRWFINDDKAARHYLIEYGAGKKDNQILGIKFIVRAHHFDKQGDIRLKCTATIKRIINTKSSQKVIRSNQRTADLHASESIQRVNKSSGIWSDWIKTVLLLLLISQWRT